MNTKPQVTFPGFPEIKFNTVIKADDNTPEVLDWQGSNGCFKAASASGEWTLTITENSISARTQLRTHTVTSNSARHPKSRHPATVVGKSERITSSMIRRVERPL